jgi:hypothetical protein
MWDSSSWTAARWLSRHNDLVHRFYDQVVVHDKKLKNVSFKKREVGSAVEKGGGKHLPKSTLD